MRLNYYRFPESIDAHTRYTNGATNIDGDCYKGFETCRACPFNNGEGWRECEYFICNDSEDTLSGISVMAAKNLLKQFGGSAWTCHIDRDGGCFETTEIKLAGNNSRHKYNRHL